MKQMAPPLLPPDVGLADDDGMRRVRFRLWQVFLTTVTVLITAWLCTLGAIAAVAALMIAKHVLVAILVMGLGVDEVPD